MRLARRLTVLGLVLVAALAWLRLAFSPSGGALLQQPSQGDDLQRRRSLREQTLLPSTETATTTFKTQTTSGLRTKAGSVPTLSIGAKAAHGNQSWFAQLTQAVTPVVLTAQSVDAEGRCPGMNGKSLIQLDPVIVSRLPRHDWARERRYRTCAIVGNSGALLNAERGHDIDEHEAVLRINYAPIVGFEKHVGSKTTFDFSNRENAKRLLKSKGSNRDGVRWRKPASTIVFFEIASNVNRRAIFSPLLRQIPDQAINFLAPAFVGRMQQLWLAMKKELEQSIGKKYHSKAMSGFVAITMMSQMCDSINVYGFDAYDDSTPYPYHYFDRVKGVTSVHSFDMAILVYKLLAREYPLQLV